MDREERREDASAKSLPYFVKYNMGAVEKVVNEVPKKESNLQSVADAIGVKAGKPMNFEEADEMRGNPNYAKGAMYKTNCQSAAVANELRRRGLDVEAYGNNKSEWYMPFELGKRPEAAWLTNEGKIPTPKIVKEKIDTTTLADSMKEEGRYQLWFNWNGKNKGHVITAERLADGRIRYFDAQSGKYDFKFLYSFDEIDATEGVRILRLDDLEPNEKLIGGIVKAAKSKEKAPRMTMEQISWWLENVQGATSFMGDIEPYSDEIIKQLKKCKTKAQRSSLLEGIARDKGATVLNDNGKAFTTCFPGHRAMKGETWKNTRQMALDLNDKGISVCFLPEHKDKISADAIVKIGDTWKLADFKCSKSQKVNTIELDIAHAFEQAECCVLKVLKADKGVICDVIDYLVRNNIQIRDFVFINKLGKNKIITKSDVERGKYMNMLKGFF